MAVKEKNLKSNKIMNNGDARKKPLLDFGLNVCVGVFLEEEMATHSSMLSRTFPWTEEPGGLQSIELHRVGHD